MTGLLYAASTQLMDRLGIEPGDGREGALLECLDAASRWIEVQTGRKFYPTASQARYYTLVYPWHTGGTQVRIDDVQSVTLLETDNNGDGAFETTWTVGTDYYLGPLNNAAKGKPYNTLYRTSLTGRYYFPAYENAIRVTGTFGFATSTPPEITELCLVAAEQLARNVLDASVPGAESYKLGAELQVSMRSPDLTPMARRILALYREREFVT